MANPTQEQLLKILANVISEQINKEYGEEMGFFLAISPFSESENISDYISNIQREDAIKTLRETADRLEQNQVIPATQGGIQ